MNKVYLLTGGNLGNLEETLLTATDSIGKFCGPIVKKSSLYETAAWGKTDQPAFLNQALELDTYLTAPQLMIKLLSIEEELGRRRLEQYGPRIIDIDILLFNHEIVNHPMVTIPHPQLANRRFALVPLHEIAGDYIHPVLNKSISALLQDCPDLLPVKKFS